MYKLDTVVLDNGLTVYLYPDFKRHSTFFQFNTYCGGATKHFLYDGKEWSLPDGVAHILEHYLVECNERGNFLTELGEKQMSTNASTSPIVTSYYFETVYDVAYGIQTLLDGIYHVDFQKEKLEKLKNPIYQEIRGRMDNKFYYANRRTMENLFPHVDFRDVGGTLQEVESITIEQVKLLYDAFYQPKNQFIVIAGNFQKEEVLEEIRSFFQKEKFSFRDVEVLPYPEDLSVRKKRDQFSFLSPMDYAEVSFKIDISSYTNIERLNLDFYLNVFYHSAFDIPSSLHQKLVDEKVITGSICCRDSIFDHFLIVTIGAYTKKPQVFLNAVLEEVHNLDFFDEEIFDVDKKNAILNLILRQENIFKMIFPFINNILYYDYPYLDQVEDVYHFQYDDYVQKIRDLDFSHYSLLTIKKE